VADPKVPAAFPKAPAIQVKDLSFRYPTRSGFRLEDFDFKINPGQIQAIVGPSGSGKSTLGNLLLRFWGGYQGEIRLGVEGIDLTTLDQREVRGNFSTISQGDFLFRDTIRNNIALGKPESDLDQVMASAQKAQIHDLIESLPEGYETMIGERGQLFSAGEAQRINIARAVLKDAPIFLLDEPTANLDPVTERALLETLFQVMEGKTTLLITHRLVGLEKVDQILVLDRGKIMERGTEAALLADGGFYHQIWSQQNRILRV
jgi:ABC-type multidrug transport system fused ATPase/permease subunit